MLNGRDAAFPGDTIPAVVPRWEWRTFFSEGVPGELRDRLMVGASAPEASDETYILSLASPHNVRIRTGRLAIKLLDASERGLERWRPVLETPFPIDAAGIRVACEAWAIPAPAVIPRHETAGDFLRDIVRPVAALRAVSLLKRRTRIEIAGCAAEHAALEIDGATWETLAIEDADPERVLAAIEELGLGPRPNASYPAALKRITDFTSTPAVATEEGIW